MASGGMNKRTNMFCWLPMSLSMDNASDVVPKGGGAQEKKEKKRRMVKPNSIKECNSVFRVNGRGRLSLRAAAG